MMGFLRRLLLRRLHDHKWETIMEIDIRDKQDCVIEERCVLQCEECGRQKSSLSNLDRF